MKSSWSSKGQSRRPIIIEVTEFGATLVYNLPGFFFRTYFHVQYEFADGNNQFFEPEEKIEVRQLFNNVCLMSFPTFQS